MVGAPVSKVEFPFVDALQTVTAFAKKERMFRRVSRLLVAVSGGGDSLATLLLLLRLRDEFGFEVLAAHFDHKLRESSLDDLEYVRGVCEGLGVKYISGEGDVAGAAEQSDEGVEATARRARYEFLAFAAGKERAEAVATGHTFDDQAETVLQRVVRGSGVRGLRGMLPVSPLPGAEAIRLVRPLLPLRREQTLALCSEAGIEPLTDPSNADLSMQRNRIRHETLGYLRELNPSVADALVRLAQNARESFAPVEESSTLTQPLSRGSEGSVFSRDAVQALSSDARTLIIERESGFLKTETLVNSTLLANLDDILRGDAGRVGFGETEVEVSGGLVRIGKLDTGFADVPETVLTVPGVVAAGGWRITVATDPIPVGEGAIGGTVSMAAACLLLRVRSLRSGDRVMRPDGARRVSALLADAKVPAWQRRRLIAVATKDAVVALLGAPEDLLPAVDAEHALYMQAEVMESG